MCRFLWTRAAGSDLLVEWEESFWLWLIYGPSASVCSFSSYSEHLSAASHDRFINEQLLQEPDCFNMQGETMLKQSDSQKIFSESNTSLQCIMWQWRIPTLSDDWVDLELTWIWAWPYVGVSMRIISIYSTLILAESGFTGRPITQIAYSNCLHVLSRFSPTVVTADAPSLFHSFQIHIVALEL